MSLYNVLMGLDSASSFLLTLLFPPDSDLQTFSRCRVRDACFMLDGEEPVIHVLTRIGSKREKDSPAEIAFLKRHPLFVRAQDEDDPSYGQFIFRFPPDLLRTTGLLETLKAKYLRKETPYDRFTGLLDRMGKPEHQNDPDVLHAIEVGMKYFTPKMEKLTREGGTLVVTDEDGPLQLLAKRNPDFEHVEFRGAGPKPFPLDPNPS